MGSLLLLLPFAHSPDADVRPIDSMFTATSAVTVTGLVTLDPGTTWTPFGQVVILVLIQIGGLGMVTTGTLMMLLVSRRLGLATRLAATAETPGVSLGDVRRILWFALMFTMRVELVGAAVLTCIFALRYGYDWREAAWYGLFHMVSAFNNAGFALFPDGLIGFQGDPLFLLTIMAAIVIGGLGLPVYLDIQRHGWLKPRHWSIHSKLTIGTTVVLLVVGAVFLTIFEWSNPGTNLSGTQRERGAERRIRIGHRPHRRLQHLRLRRGDRGDHPHDLLPDDHRRRLGLNGGRHQGDDFHRADAGGVGRGPRLPRRQRGGSAPVAEDAAHGAGDHRLLRVPAGLRGDGPADACRTTR